MRGLATLRDAFGFKSEIHKANKQISKAIPGTTSGHIIAWKYDDDKSLLKEALFCLVNLHLAFSLI